MEIESRKVITINHKELMNLLGISNGKSIESINKHDCMNYEIIIRCCNDDEKD